MLFHEFFYAATGNDAYPFQHRLAERATWPRVLKVPTGSGKTAAVVLAWIWRRRFHPDPAVQQTTPRRLVYCLPMRVLVEQTRDNVYEYLDRLGLLRSDRQSRGCVDVNILMGGEVDEGWYLYPEREAVIIGTQDMLLSRALNRGYVLSRFRWPVPFGLLNNDALWVLDEVQLMGVGVPTTAQLHAFRQDFGTLGPADTLWMSATLRPEWLGTVDHPTPTAGESLELAEDEKEHPGLKARLRAPKVLERLPVRASPNAAAYPAEVARKVAGLHHPGTLTLVMVNTVDRAQKVYRAVRERGRVSAEVLLLHSRLRPPERQAKLAELLKPIDPNGPGRIVVCTQVLEAGVDISSALLVTELAPWPSLVQRFGRVNRYGEFNETRVYWIDVPGSHTAPYSPSVLEVARHLLESLERRSVAPHDLPDPDLPVEHHEVLRRRDLVDLFDTSPDLSGNDTDVSRFIRDARESDVRVCWRAWPNGEPSRTWPRPVGEELCPVPVGGLRDWLGQAGREAWSWDHLDRRWRRLHPREIWPGQVVVLRAEHGGYDPELGWSPGSTRAVEPYGIAATDPEEAGGDDHLTFLSGRWQTLVEHSNQVVQEVEALLNALDNPELELFAADLVQAARYHDWGKAHPVFQETLLAQVEAREHYAGTVWAKAERARPPEPHGRPHFRHELTSLLALLAQKARGEEPGASMKDLAFYLVASHHGRVRLAARSLPGRDGRAHREGSPRMVLGIQDGEVLPGIDLGDGQVLPKIRLDLSPVEIGNGTGGPSWLARALALRDELGPFRLAYLEALLRAADARASVRAAKEGKD